MTQLKQVAVVSLPAVLRMISLSFYHLIGLDQWANLSLHKVRSMSSKLNLTDTAILLFQNAGEEIGSFTWSLKSSGP